jgi:enoyl-CoA hydratase/carnithine racemase
VATIAFDRPAARNAMLFRTWCALPDLIAAAQTDPDVRVIVRRGGGGHFGAGNDIAEFASLRGDSSAARDYGWAMAHAIRAVETASRPVVAAIEGCCFGASVALALAADIRLAGNDARFAITPAKLGALYLRSDHHRLVAAIGPGQARRMIFTAQTLNAAEGLMVGLVDQLSADDQFEADLAELTQAIAVGSPYTQHHSKRMLRAAGAGETPTETDESIGWFVAAMQGADFAEGVAAFLGKRRPHFTGSATAG